jgi:hypothetical protein
MFAMRKMPWRILFVISKTHQEKKERNEITKRRLCFETNKRYLT